MIQQLKNIHNGEKIAVLGSGPTLACYKGYPPIAIAANGGAFSPFPYAYFICGDILSYKQSWFTVSEKWRARRLVASFIGPDDAIAIPSESGRMKLRKEIATLKAEAIKTDRLDVLYKYFPTILPAENHLFFRYHKTIFFGTPQTLSERKKEICLAGGGFLLKGTPFEHVSERKDNTQSVFQNVASHIQSSLDFVITGASICGVALQIAFLMGASEIHLFGCSMDNENGNNYFFPEPGIPGMTRNTQIIALRQIIDRLKVLGVPVVIHGASRISS